MIFVLGGPGSGKGTQCAYLVRDFGFHHLSAGDLLRAEQDRPGSQFGELIRRNIREGIIVPMEVTVSLLENAMREILDSGSSSSASVTTKTNPDGDHSDKPSAEMKEVPKGEDVKPNPNGKFLIDGFPRKMDQALHFEASVCPSKFTIFFDCPEEVMLQRLLHRGETSGREDDNLESIKKRFTTFVETSMPVVNYFEEKGKVVRIDATKSPEEVHEDVKTKLKERGVDLV